MTTYRRGHEASLARYNARKRELRASMLDYSEHMRHIQGHANSPSRLKNKDSAETSLEIRAEGHLFNRHADRAFLTKRLRHEQRPTGRRPSSLDEKELQLNSRVAQVSKRDTKSERPPITIPTALPPLVNPPNTPDFSKNGKVRVSFVSASDLYDLVDFGTSTRTPRKDSTRISNLHDGLKLIEDIELQNHRERNIAWEKPSNSNTCAGENSPPRDTSPSRDNSSSKLSDADVLMGKRMQRETFCSNSKESSGNTAVRKLKDSNESKGNGKSDSNSDTAGIVPLKLLLEHAAASHIRTKEKVHTRPKRAKRMQLHKSNLVVIPEDSGTLVCPGDTQSSSSGESWKTSQTTTVDASSKSSPLTLTSANSKGFENFNSAIATTPRISHDSPSRNDNNNSKSHYSDSQKPSLSSPQGDKNRKVILRRLGQGGNETSNEVTKMPDLVVTNNVYLPVPWEKHVDAERNKVKHVTFDKNISRVKARRGMKRLVFLQDQPEEDYKLEL